MRLYLPCNHTVFRETLDNIRRRHPLALQAQQYTPGKFEIGYGNRSEVHPGTHVTSCMAEDLLRNDIQYVEAYIRLAVARRISDGLYQALVSYLFDAGPKSPAARARLSALHTRGPDGFFDGLAGAASESRFDANAGRTARFYECKQHDL